MGDGPGRLIGKTVKDRRGREWEITSVSSVSELKGFRIGEAASGPTTAVTIRSDEAVAKTLHVQVPISSLDLQHVQAALTKQ